jgi:hypothetical protein
MIIVGQGRSPARTMSSAWPPSSRTLPARPKDDWNGFNVLHTAAARVGGLDIGFVPGEGGKDAARCWQGDVDVLFLLGADELDLRKRKGGFTVYIGTHGDRRRAPCRRDPAGSAYTEKSATYVNTEGRVQMTQRGAFRPGEAKETGRSCARCPKSSAKSCPSIRWRSCAPRSTRRIRIWPYRADRARRRGRYCCIWRKKAEDWASQHLHRRSKTSI